MVCLKFYFPPLPAFPSWLQGKGEGVGKPPEDSGRGQEAAAVAKRDLGEEEELGRERLGVDEAGAGGVVVCMCV